tara:strand:- start:318 stop:548 length:231 start_codon:yes stop_codon:yes gene_type:complete
MEKQTDAAIMFLIMVFLAFLDAVRDLTSIYHNGIMKDPRDFLKHKTNSELRRMLVGRKKISNLKKSELIELVISYS